MNQDNIAIYEVIPTNRFNNDVELYIRKKRFTKLSKDIDEVLKGLPFGKFKGDIIPGLRLSNGKYIYKARAANSNTHVGKSNGYRLIYFVEEDTKFIFLVTIYYKKDENRIPSDQQIKEFIQGIIKKYDI